MKLLLRDRNRLSKENALTISDYIIAIEKRDLLKKWIRNRTNYQA